MPSILPGYTYDIFISYRQKDNRGERWVTEFVKALKEELDSTFKEDVSIYFDENPHDGLLESHHVNKSLEGKLQSLIFIPILSQTYCDPKSFAWQNEFCAFNAWARKDPLGREITLGNGNVASRILPVKIHDLSPEDKNLVENELGDVLRAIEFVFKTAGVHRPLRPSEDRPQDNVNKTFYRDQINKVANAIKAIVEGAKSASASQQGKSLTPSEPVIEERKLTEEIYEKDLVKVALVYLIVALVAWKAIDLSVHLLSLGRQWSSITAVVLAALFPVSMFLAWKFERSPSGFIRSNSEAARKNPLSRRERKPLTSNSAILVLLAVMLVMYFVPQNVVSSKTSGDDPAIDNKSIAVLYFDNMSGDAAQDYLSDGLTEEIITRLTKITGLRVISRTSVGVYKGQPLNLKKIASDLNVSVVLEGSVRKAGNQLRVTAQLINADTDEHLWAESYDRELKDVFEVQKEIAQVIADKFKIAMTPEVNLQVNEISTRNMEAYEYYLKGRHIAFTQYYYIGDSMAFLRSKAMYEKAIEIDPAFALAMAGLADLYDAYRGLNHESFTPKMDSLRQSLSWKAYELAPNSGFVNDVRIWMLVNRDKDPLYDSAFFHARKALIVEPNDYLNHESMGFLFRDLGLHELATPFLKKATNINPLEAIPHTMLGQCYFAVGERDLGDKEMQLAHDLAPVQAIAAFPVLNWLVDRGRFREAEAMIDRVKAVNPKFDFKINSIRKLIAEGKMDEARKMMPNEGGALRSYALLGMRKELIKALTEIHERGLDFYLNLKNLGYMQAHLTVPEVQDIMEKQKLRHESRVAHYSRFLEGL
jgi:adenylate cyclase